MTLRQADSVSPTDRLSVEHTEQSKFRPDIEGLRALTLLAILLFHAGVPGVDGGFIGPDVFFIISGFVITGQLLREVSSTGTLKLRPFYGARARRLLPVAALVGVVTVVASAFLLPPFEARSAVGDGIACALYVGNYWFIAQNVDYFGGHFPPSPFQHYWTLGVEEQFYLIWPLMIIGTAWLIRRTAARRRAGTDAASPDPSQRPYFVVLALIAVSSFALSLVTTYLVPSAAYFSLPTRAWDLAVGGLVAVTAQRWRRLPDRSAKVTGWVGLALILLACNRFTPATPYPGTAALVPMLGTALVLGAGCATPTQGCGRILALAPMRALGRLSYSWYLWHWPLLVLAPVLLGHSLGLAGRLTAVLISGGLAVLTLRFVENPLRYAPALRRSPVASLAVGGAATAVAACVGVAMTTVIPVPAGRGAPTAGLTVTAAPAAAGSDMHAYDAAVQHAFAQVQAVVAASADLKAVPSNLDPPLDDVAAEQNAMVHDGCFRADKESGQPECATGDTTSSTTVALVGDSHAAMWDPAFEQIATQRHWRLEMMAKAGCPLIAVPIAKHLDGVVEHFRHCEQWRALILARLRAEHPRLVMVSMSRMNSAGSWQPGFTPYDQAWLDALLVLVQQLRATGAEVLVFGPVPDPNTSVPDCLSGHLDDASACSPARSAAVNQSGIAAESAATHAGGGEYADLTELFCTPNRCPVIVGNTMVYFDWNHLTHEYARLLAPAMGPLADRALARG
ncbi:acyltransferase family protein [Mycobacterium parmense]|uniref:Acyltransferase n=1 Tax=Mycobacterium parmense TaxID=185642 RepID=A0A7I7YTG2_9MYCO|nr:acyltransferase family protein [Mycobacterium parmense]MCV7348965.1 acyltransferase [Mycobacterium parmense]ORW56877.1 acyltransferase [Mycobacterium parmense]BBZ44482.1 acyltransferase [Mycobacterium parmense]